MSNMALDDKSFNKVNYLLRPRKQIERKILIEMFRNLDNISSYQYVGMGSIFY
ncbi:MAG: O-methyltransferase, partial [Candidatus Zixiibacteriota bacterium]